MPGVSHAAGWASHVMYSRVFGVWCPSVHTWQRYMYPRAFKGIALFSGVACAIVAPTVALGLQQHPGPTPRSAYHRAAEADSDSFLTNRQHMLAFFTADVRRMQSPRWPLGGKAPAGGRALDIRVLQWNVRAWQVSILSLSSPRLCSAERCVPMAASPTGKRTNGCVRP